MDAIQAIKTRRSIRKFQDKPIPRDVLENIVDCGRLAASGRNDQPWEFVVVTDPAIKDKIANATDYGKFIAQAAACIAVFCKDTTYYIEDGSAASQNILVSAWAQGVGTCWIAGDKKHYAETIGEIVKAPEGIKLVSLIALGYPNEQPTREKRELQDVLHWDSF
ncbi:MAG: nitroreductase family protein [Firmicutes bacterium]|mgnify:FL=1|nr:nitroreductase family protein [Bacillota bacterium]